MTGMLKLFADMQDGCVLALLYNTLMAVNPAQQVSPNFKSLICLNFSHSFTVVASRLNLNSKHTSSREPQQWPKSRPNKSSQLRLAQSTTTTFRIGPSASTRRWPTQRPSQDLLLMTHNLGQNRSLAALLPSISVRTILSLYHLRDSHNVRVLDSPEHLLTFNKGAITCCVPCVTFGKTHHRSRKDADLEGYTPVNATVSRILPISSENTS